MSQRVNWCCSYRHHPPFPFDQAIAIAPVCALCWSESASPLIFSCVLVDVESETPGTKDTGWILFCCRHLYCDECFRGHNATTLFQDSYFFCVSLVYGLITTDFNFIYFCFVTGNLQESRHEFVSRKM
jgi:hypothetical protein